MYYEFYIDQFFLEQLLVGYLLLKATVSFRRLAVSGKRIFLGSLANALVTAAGVCLGLAFLFPAGMISAGLVVYSGRRGGGVGKGLLTLAFFTLCFAGMLEGLISLTGLPFMAAAVAAGILVRTMTRWTVKRRKLDMTVTVQLWRGEKKTEVQGIVDTGNHLIEPLTGKPVSIVDEEAMEKLLETGWEKDRGFCLIPYHSIGKDRGWLRGITVDRMVVETPGNITEIRSPILALHRGHVSSRNRYQIILHPLHGSPEV